jgi:hypothetical protein
MADRDRFSWEIQPKAAVFLTQLVNELVQGSPFAEAMRKRMLDETGTRLFDWIDHLCVPTLRSEQLRELGFEQSAEDSVTWVHQEGLFPPVRLSGPAGIAIKVDDVAIFVSSMNLSGSVRIIGERGDRFRRADRISTEPVSFAAIERHGYRGFEPVPAMPESERIVKTWSKRFDQRPRPLVHEADGFVAASQLFNECQSELGRDWACDLFFAAERRYWQSRNHAGRIQFARQNRLGLGWANHDHHTYRCSRSHFARLIRLLEGMGFSCRERFYAGREAGWGAQVLEQPITGITIFADVDLTPEEVSDDFAHGGLMDRTELGTVGLWCKLHGESFLRAGMHHLECQFDFDSARRQLTAAGIESMPPFTYFPHLKQAFTKGEIWPVDRDRLAELVAAGSIAQEQSDRFALEGAIGSHLEVLERNDGYKGFNQTGISDIISRTDPRSTRH